LCAADRCSIAMVGGMPSISSTSGFLSWSRNCRAYADSDSMYFRCPSAKIVSNASDDLPEPESPVITIRRSRGSVRSTSLRLCSFAPRTRITRSASALRWIVMGLGSIAVAGD
jgi:hypothetical protein